mgnify:CR=1 FL=1
MNVLEVRNLRTHFFTDGGVVRAVDDVSFSVPKGKTLGLVGESGCGKSVTATSVLRLVPSPPGRYLGGEIRFGSVDLLKLPREELPKIRGKDIAMIFQDPMTSLNPVFTIGNQIREAIELHQDLSPKASRDKAIARRRPSGDQAGAELLPLKLATMLRRRLYRSCT